MIALAPPYAAPSLVELRQYLVQLDRQLLRTPDALSALEFLEGLAGGADPDPEHAFRVGRVSRVLGEQVFGDRRRAVELEHAARLHDIGKLAVRRRVLLQPRSLSMAERRHVAVHTRVPGPLLRGLRHPILRLARKVAGGHHERWDGHGYPRATFGEATPVAARIVAAADLWDALVHDRPYRRALSVGTAAAILRKLRGKALDPEITDLLLDSVASGAEAM